MDLKLLNFFNNTGDRHEILIQNTFGRATCDHPNRL